MHKSVVSFRLALAAVLCLLFVVAPMAVLAMDADELIAKNIEATGGLKKIKSNNSLSIEGNILVQGMEIPFTMIQKRPGNMRIEATVMGMTMVQCFADGKGWAINPMMGSTDPQPMPEMEAKSFELQSDMDGPLVDYKDKGYTVEYAGEDEVEDTPCYKLSLDNQDGIVMNLFLDKEYYLTIMQETKMMVDGTEVVSQTYMSDFQEVDGLVMPYAIETRMGGTVVSQIMFKSVQLNQDIDDSVFAQPAAAPAE